jgi:hypothetical protein
MSHTGFRMFLHMNACHTPTQSLRNYDSHFNFKTYISLFQPVELWFVPTSTYFSSKLYDLPNLNFFQQFFFSRETYSKSCKEGFKIESIEILFIGNVVKCSFDIFFYSNNIFKANHNLESRIV